MEDPSPAPAPPPPQPEYVGNKDHHLAIFGDDEEVYEEEAAAETAAAAALGDGGGPRVTGPQLLFGDGGDGSYTDMLFGDHGAATWSELDAVMGDGGREGGDAAGDGVDVGLLFGDEERTGSGMKPVQNTVMNVGDEGRASEQPTTDYGSSVFLEDMVHVPTSDIGTPLVIGSVTMAHVPTSDIGTPLVTGSVTMDGRDLSDELNKRRMEELLVGTDLGMDELDGGEQIAELNQSKENKVSDVGDVDAGMEVEGAGAAQRERKRSKYLSPPYTDSNPDTEQLAQHVDTGALVTCSDKKTKDNMSPSAIYENVDVKVIHSHLLSTAVDHFHLKRSSFQRTFRGFCEEFRCSGYVGMDLGSDDKVHPVDLEPTEGRVTRSGMSDMADGSEKVKATRKRNRKKVGANAEAESMSDGSEKVKPTRKRNRKKDGANAEAEYMSDDSEKVKPTRKRNRKKVGANAEAESMSDGSEKVKPARKRNRKKVGANAEAESMSDGSEKVKATRKRNRKKDGANVETESPTNLDHDKVKSGNSRQRKKVKTGVDGENPKNLVTPSVNGSDGKSKINAGGKPIPDLTTHDPFEFSEGEVEKKDKSKGAALNVTPLNSRPEPVAHSEGSSLGQQMTKRDSEVNALARQSASGSKGRKSLQKQKIEEAISVSPAALILTFTPGATLPSKDELHAKYSPYGDLLEPRPELVNAPCTACVVFARSSDAEAAFNSPDKKTVFGSLLSCRLRFLLDNMPSSSLAQPVEKAPQRVKKTPLPNIKSSLANSSLAHPVEKPPQRVRKTPPPNIKSSPASPSLAQPVEKPLRRVKNTLLTNMKRSLARMITSLTGTPSDDQAAGAPGWLKLEEMENVVSDLKALMEKVDGLLTSPPAANAT